MRTRPVRSAMKSKPSGGMNRTPFSLPTSLRQKLGIHVNPTIAIFRGGDGILKGPNLPERASVFDEFKINCAKSRLRGLACFADREIAHLSESFATVVRRFCAEMAFQGHEEAVSTLAEALLQVLRFRTPGLHIDQVKLTTTFEKSGDSSAVSLATIAKWRPGNEAASVDQPESRKVEVIVRNAAEEKDEAEHHEEHETDNVDPSDDKQATVSASESSSIVPESTATTESLSSLLQSLPNHQKIELAFGSRSCPPAGHKVGMTLYRLVLLWIKGQGNAISNLTRSQLFRMIESSTANAPGHGLFAAAGAARMLADMVPGGPVTILYFQKPLDIDLKQEYGTRRGFVDLSVKSSTNEKQPTGSLSVPGSRWHQFSVDQNFSRRPDCVFLEYKFRISGLAESGDVNEDILTSTTRIQNTIDAYIEPVIRNKPAENLDHLVTQCAETITKIPQPLAGILNFTAVHVNLHTVVDNKIVETVKKAMPSVLSEADRAPRVVEAVPDRIFVALGSNLGDRFAAIESACRNIDDIPDTRIVRTSALFETDPMYVENQGRFLNGVCQIETRLEPMELLDRLQAIENNLGRVKTIDKGPRNIDLDIVAYGQSVLETERLVIPHRLMLEREFVLRPLNDIARYYKHPTTMRTVEWHLAQLQRSDTPMYPLTPLAPGCEPLRSLDPGRKTLIMSILNVTPDSFSDGGLNQPTNTERLKATAASHIAAGAAIIDIGGQSSRPHAPDISAEEEIARVLPAIEAIRSLPEASRVAISVDTYRAAVAEAAIKAGAHIVNDISAGLLDPEMLPTIARLGCTYIMMHMRGTPHTMQNDENTSYPQGLIITASNELRGRLDAAQEAGIRRWRIIVDPGVGFAKTTEQNLEILRELGRLRNSRTFLQTVPWLVGSSRKGFIGKITGVEKASERIEGTAATVTAAIAGGAEIVRVHDVEEMARVVKMADAIYRVPLKKE